MFIFHFQHDRDSMCCPQREFDRRSHVEKVEKQTLTIFKCSSSSAALISLWVSMLHFMHIAHCIIAPLERLKSKRSVAGSSEHVASEILSILITILQFLSFFWRWWKSTLQHFYVKSKSKDQSLPVGGECNERTNKVKEQQKGWTGGNSSSRSKATLSSSRSSTAAEKICLLSSFQAVTRTRWGERNTKK